MKNLITRKLSYVIVLVIAFSFNSFGQQKEMKMVDLSSSKMEKSRGENPNIIKDFVFNAPDVAVPKPAESRGMACTVNTINNTGYTVYVYIDGYYKGYINPWSSGEVTVGAGYTTVYIRTSGGTYYWSTDGNCDYYFNYTIRI